MHSPTLQMQVQGLVHDNENVKGHIASINKGTGSCMTGQSSSATTQCQQRACCLRALPSKLLHSLKAKYKDKAGRGEMVGKEEEPHEDCTNATLESQAAGLSWTSAGHKGKCRRRVANSIGKLISCFHADCICSK